MTAQDQSGFSVLEALVAVLLTSLIAIMLAGSIRTETYAWRQSDAIARDLEGRRAVSRFLRSVLHTVYPMEEKAGGRWVTSFSGTSNKITFVGFLPPVAQQNGMGVIDLLSLGKDGDVALQMGWEQSKVRHSRILARDLESIEFTYSGSRAGGAGDSDWVKEWKENVRLPDLIRIRIRRKGGSPDQVIVLSPKMEVSVRCQYDPVTYDCRFD